MLPSQAKQIKTEAAGYCNACGCTGECVLVLTVGRRYSNVTTAVFMWLKSLGKAQTWRVCSGNLGLGNQNSHSS